jgi:hypothetical protein
LEGAFKTVRFYAISANGYSFPNARLGTAFPKYIMIYEPTSAWGRSKSIGSASKRDSLSLGLGSSFCCTGVEWIQACV